MSPSCRVRRSTFSSPYSRLLNEADARWDGQQETPHSNLAEPVARAQPVATASLGPLRTQRRGSVPITRPRSRTLADIFNEHQDEGDLSPRLRAAATFPVSSQSQPSNGPEGVDAGSSRRPGLVTGHLASRRSQLTLNSRRPVSPRPSEVAVHGSQIDILFPEDSQPGLVETALSRSSLENLHHDDDVVEHLEVIDPHVAAVSHLSNAANSILVPRISSLYSRRPIIYLPRSDGVSPQDITEKGGRENLDEIDVRVQQLLHKRDELRRTAAGVWSFVKTPMGIITAMYGFCVAFWGSAIIFFLAGWVPTSSTDRKGFWVEVSSQIENALFTVTGVGLIPWRVVDTYRILKVWNFKRITRKRRKIVGLPELYDEDDLPDPVFDVDYVHVLTDQEQNDLHHQQKQFTKSQTWYRPHGTETHRAFPIRTALLICLFIDGNSVFQVMLCGCMWGLDRFQRPAWTTGDGTLIPASFMCGIVAAILIWKGGQKTKRTKVVEARLRAALADENPTVIITVPGRSSVNSTTNNNTAAASWK